MKKENDDNIIDIKNFSIKFGSFTAVNDLTFQVKRGETFGLLGSNGSGKTTTLRSLLGVYMPTSGELLLNGKPFSVSSKTTLGYLPEERGLYKNEPVLDVMVYFGKLKGMTASDAKEWSIRYLERVNLKDKAKVKIGKLSGGQQQKVQLGVTVMNNPDLLILDEPTKGFDPVNRKLLMDIIEEQKQAGATIILVTHHMEEVERLCDRIILLKDGVAAEYGSIEEVKGRHDGASLDDIFVKIYGNHSLEEMYA